MAKKVLIWDKTGIFYEFSKWLKIEIHKPINRAAEIAEKEWVEGSS